MAKAAVKFVPVEVESTPAAPVRHVGTLSSDAALAVGAVADLDTRWKPAQASRGSWLLDIAVSDTSRLPAEELRGIVAALLRGKHVEVLADGVVRAHTSGDQDTRSAEVTIRKSLETSERSGLIRFTKWTDHTPSLKAADTARGGASGVFDAESATLAALPAGTYDITETTDASGRLVVSFTRR